MNSTKKTEQSLYGQKYLNGSVLLRTSGNFILDSPKVFDFALKSNILSHQQGLYLQNLLIRTAVNDTYRHKGLRKRLVDSLRQRGINDEAVLTAMDTVPRHFFLDRAFEEHAYADKPFPIGNEQTISQPYTVAYMTALLKIKRGDRVLEIGTGSGYQAAILAAMGARVFTVERQEALFQQAKALLAKIGFPSIRCFFRDGTKGMPEYAPYQKIIVTAGAPVVPEPLKQQLGIGGILIIPVGEDVQYMYQITRVSKTEFKKEVFDAFRFVPFLEGLNKKA